MQSNLSPSDTPRIPYCPLPSPLPEIPRGFIINMTRAQWRSHLKIFGGERRCTHAQTTQSKWKFNSVLSTIGVGRNGKLEQNHVAELGWNKHTRRACYLPTNIQTSLVDRHLAPAGLVIVEIYQHVVVGGTMVCCICGICLWCECAVMISSKYVHTRGTYGWTYFVVLHIPHPVRTCHLLRRSYCRSVSHYVLATLTCIKGLCYICICINIKSRCIDKRPHNDHYNRRTRLAYADDCMVGYVIMCTFHFHGTICSLTLSLSVWTKHTHFTLEKRRLKSRVWNAPWDIAIVVGPQATALAYCNAAPWPERRTTSEIQRNGWYVRKRNMHRHQRMESIQMQLIVSHYRTESNTGGTVEKAKCPECAVVACIASQQSPAWYGFNKDPAFSEIDRAIYSTGP